MNTGSLITIILPVRNRADLLPRTLHSLAAQSLRPLKVIAVDNASTDSTHEILTRWAEEVATTGLEVTVLQEKKPGASAARNRGLREVTTPYVMFFDSDDEMLPGHTLRLAECIAANPQAEVIGFDIAVRDDDGWTDIKSVNDSDLLRGHILHASIATQKFITKTNFVKTAGGWNEDLPRWNDLELGTRLLAAAKNPMIFHGDAGVIVHPSDKSISASGFAKDANLLNRAIDEMETDLRNNGKKEYLVWTGVRRMILAALIRREGDCESARTMETIILKRHNGWKWRFKLRLIGATVRFYGRGGCLLAEMLFSTKPQER
ncbi:MAG: glycosyltransferase family 2 protein [Paramuribaculum sp.]|nr:glycosyltransferase family 2 protein [Paramuribaculum sp.]